MIFAIYLLIGQSPEKIDLGILLDTSEDSGYVGFELAKKFIAQQLKFLSISLSATRISLVTLNSTSAMVKFGYKKFVNRECIMNVFNKLR